MIKKTPNVAFIRDELAVLIPQYQLITDAISGEVAIKNAGDKYLPRPNAADRSRENKLRYESYKKRAVFYNVTRRTLSGYVGQMFLRPPTLDYPEIMEAVVNNASGTGVSLELLAKTAAKYTLSLSRAGVFVDYPRVDAETTSYADLQSGRVRPTINVVHPLSIINWRTRDIGAESVLSLVVIAEDFCAFDDGFEVTYEPQWRVLGLDENGYYYQELWRNDKDQNGRTKKDEYVLFETIYPTGADGNYLNFIPFQFMGTVNNDSSPDNPNFYDLASLNISHYCNSADFEESVYMTGQPTLVISGVDDQWAKDNNGAALVGSVGGIAVPKDGDAKFIQAAPNTLVQKAMDMKEKQMVALGARIVEDRSVQRTATEANIDSASESSILASTAKNVSEAMENAFKWAASFIGIDPSLVQFKLSTDFDITKLKADERKQLLEEWQKGLITFDEARRVLTRSGVAYEDNEVARQKIANETSDELISPLDE